MWLHDLIADKPADAFALIDFDGAAFTYGQLRDMVGIMTDTLAAHGVRPGDRVMLVSENCATYAVAILAASHLQAWICPVNARQSHDELAAIAAHATPRCMVFTPEVSDQGAAHAQNFGAMEIGRLACGAISVTPCVDAIPEPVEDDPRTRVAALMYTTGTTSAPKGVMLTHENLCWNARLSAQLRQVRADDIVLVVLPGTHIFGFASTFLASLFNGSVCRFQPRFSPQAVLDALADGVAIMPAVPQMYAAILIHLEQTGTTLNAPKLRYISAGGAPLDPDWKQRTEAVFGLTLNNGYGLTETAPGVAATRPDDPVDNLSVGPALPEVELTIDAPDEHGIGELLIRSPGIMKGYYRNPKITAQVLSADKTFRSGDLARIDDRGHLHIVGRLKELIIRSGFNIYPPEIEAMLTRHPDVHQAAVVGRTVPGNEEVLAFVLSNGKITEDALMAWLKDKLVAYKCPQHIFIVDAFPTAATGKILKHKLILEFQDLINIRTGSAAANV